MMEPVSIACPMALTFGPFRGYEPGLAVSTASARRSVTRSNRESAGWMNQSMVGTEALFVIGAASARYSGHM